MWIDCATVKENLPAVFKEKLFVDCTEFRCEVPKVHLMDCTEFRCEVPKDPSKQSELDVSSPGEASSPNDALSPRGSSSPNNYLPPDKNIAGANATQEVNVTVSKSSTRNKKKITVTTAKCWNYLPLKLRTCSSIYIFKKELYRKLKTNQINDKVFNPFLDNLL